MSTPPGPPSKQRQTVQRWAAAISSLDVDAIAPTLSDVRYEHHFLPSAAANVLGIPVYKSKKEYIEGFRGMLGLLQSFKVSDVSSYRRYLVAYAYQQPTVHEIIETPGKVVVHVCSPLCSQFYTPDRMHHLAKQLTGDGASTTGHPFLCEWIIIYHLEEESDGEVRIVLVKEFLDSHFMVPFMVEETKRLQELKGN